MLLSRSDSVLKTWKVIHKWLVGRLFARYEKWSLTCSAPRLAFRARAASIGDIGDLCNSIRVKRKDKIRKTSDRVYLSKCIRAIPLHNIRYQRIWCCCNIILVLSCNKHKCNSQRSSSLGLSVRKQKSPISWCEQALVFVHYQASLPAPHFVWPVGQGQPPDEICGIYMAECKCWEEMGVMNTYQAQKFGNAHWCTRWRIITRFLFNKVATNISAIAGIVHRQVWLCEEKEWEQIVFFSWTHRRKTNELTCTTFRLTCWTRAASFGNLWIRNHELEWDCSIKYDSVLEK